MMRATRFLGFGGPLVVTVLILNAIAAQAFGPYKSGTTGYDVSYPQCPGTTAPAGAFGIIGANAGRPFSVNPCFGNEYVGAANSVYINTGYARAYRGNITSGCSSGPSTAWEIGCSEAETSINGVGGRSVSMWWLDVETANSWSGNRSVNQATIQGAITRLDSAGPVGVYSTAYAWGRVAGSSFAPAGVSGIWLPAPQCSGASSFIKGETVWLTQRVVGSVDVDTAC